VHLCQHTTGDQTFKNKKKYNQKMEVHGKPSMGMPPSVHTVHYFVSYPEGKGYPGKVLFGEKGCLCCVQHRHKNENSLGKVTRRGVTPEKGVV